MRNRGKKIANQPVIALTACLGNIFLFAASGLVCTDPTTTQDGYFRYAEPPRAGKAR